MKLTQNTSAAWLISILLFATSCTEKIVRPFQEIAEPEYCTTTSTYTPSYTITGSARFKRRSIGETCPGVNCGLGPIEAGDHPIRQAEIQVVNSAGTIIQCSETLANGTFSFQVPQGGGNYIVKILSRSYNNQNKASVLEDPYANIPYEISTSFVADSTKSIGSIVASAANNDLRGGAFNILDRIYEANAFLLANATGFTVTHKVQAYWAKGVNPVTYFGGDANSGVSFYVPGTDKLYILGGIEGDVTIEDTDHFDDSVIIHEYGHFVEDNYSKSDSPGGAHYGSYAIDPRLAWSEAFATFLSTQALAGNAYYEATYKDTIGIGGGFGFYYDAEDNQNFSGSSMDMPAAGALGEGNFRELAVLRFLWSAIDSTAFTFGEFWDIYTDQFVNSDPFREMSLFLEQQDAHGTTDLTALYPDNDKEMDGTRRHYGTRDIAGVNDPAQNACRWNIQASAKLPSIAGSSAFDRSNPFYSNDFFYHYHSGGTLSVVLTYDIASSTAADLDLYVYKDGYSFGVGSDILTYSNKPKCPSSGTCESGIESISISAPAGNYMINVMYYNDGSGSPVTTYNLLMNGTNYICR